MHVRMRMRKTRRCGRAPFPPAHPPPAPHARESPHGRHTARRHGESGGACNLARENTACPVSKNALRQRTIRTAQTTHTSGRRHTTHASELEKSVKVSCQQTADSRTGVTPELENPSRRRSIRFLQATTEHCGILLKLVMYVSRHVVRNPPPHPIPSHPIPSRSVRPLTPAAPPPAPRPPPPAVARSRRRPHNPRASPPPPAPRPPRRPASPRQRTAWRPPARSTARRAKPPPPPPPPPPADDGAAACRRRRRRRRRARRRLGCRGGVRRQAGARVRLVAGGAREGEGLRGRLQLPVAGQGHAQRVPWRTESVRRKEKKERRRKKKEGLCLSSSSARTVLGRGRLRQPAAAGEPQLRGAGGGAVAHEGDGRQGSAVWAGRRSWGRDESIAGSPLRHVRVEEQQPPAGAGHGHVQRPWEF